MSTIVTCHICKQLWEMRPWQLRPNVWQEPICVPCKNKRRREWYARRKARGEVPRRRYKSTAKVRAYNREYQRRWRKKHREHHNARAKERRQDPELKYREQVGHLVHAALKAGRLVKQPCQVCGAKEVHGHHEDYGKPFEVQWLCPLHHKQRHALMRVARKEKE